MPLLEELLNKVRIDGEWLYPFADCVMVSGTLIGIYVLNHRLEAAAELADSLELHPGYEVDLSTNILAAQGRIVAFRLGNPEKGKELIECLSEGRIPGHLVFNLIRYITEIYDENAPMPPDALNLCIELANTAGHGYLAEHFQSAATVKDIDGMNRMAGEANYRKRHPDKT